jgi:hypothetical protein
MARFRRFMLLGLVMGLVGLVAVHQQDKSTSAAPAPAQPAASAPAQPGARTCWTYFVIAINSGPHAGVSLVGTLTLNIEASGKATGVLENGPMAVVATGDLQLPSNEVKVVGEVHGHAVNLAFDLGDPNYVMGTGTSVDDLDTCNGAIPGVIGGPAVGPAFLDAGEWSATARDYVVCALTLVVYCAYIFFHG